MLDDEIFLRQPLQHRHDRRIREVAARSKSLVDLSHRLRFERGPEVFHHFALEFPEPRQFGHVLFTLLSNGFRVLRAYYRVSYPSSATATQGADDCNRPQGAELPSQSTRAFR